MSAFYIGQRVRIVNVVNPELQYLLGRETLIVDRAPPEFSRSEWTLAERDTDGYPFFAHSRNLEPILPPGLESPPEIAALYEPEDAIA